MKITAHAPRAFANAIQALLPPGAAWTWPEGGLGDAMLLGTAEELARIEAAVQGVMDNAVDSHRPKFLSWHISAYQGVADAVGGAAEPGGVRVSTVRPFAAGGAAGGRLWGPRSRYILWVRYDGAAGVDPAALWAALSEFRQSHVVLWIDDITGAGGVYASN